MRLLQTMLVLSALVAPSSAAAQMPPEVAAFVGDLTGSEVLELLSSSGVSAGAYLSSASDEVPPRPVPPEMGVARTQLLQDILAAWSATHPGWTTSVDAGVVTIAAPGLAGTYRPIGNVQLQSAGLDQAVNAMIHAVDSSVAAVEVSPASEEVSITLDPQGMTIVEAFNALVRQVPGTTWTFIRSADPVPSDTFRMKTASGRSWSVRLPFQPIL